jgi:L-ascorbate metabolism protein UlaG (beta-lactamase superfamily)
VTTATVAASDTVVIDAHITRADFILVTHTHPDHTLDLPYIAKKTGATVIGTQSTVNLARASGVAPGQLRVVSGHEELKFGDVTVRVMQDASPTDVPPNFITCSRGFISLPAGQFQTVASN